MFVCKSISLANFLISNGCILIKIDKDKVSNDYLIFLFKKNENLKNALDKWNK